MVKASTFNKRSYTNGYEQKVNYYLERLDKEFQNEDVDAIKFCKKKLDYFVGKQIEYLTNQALPSTKNYWLRRNRGEAK